MVDFVVIAILAVVVGSALRYLIKARKNGIKCVGCPAGGNCCSCRQAGETTSTCGCGSGSESGSGCGCHADAK